MWQAWRKAAAKVASAALRSAPPEIGFDSLGTHSHLAPWTLLTIMLTASTTSRTSPVAQLPGISEMIH